MYVWNTHHFVMAVYAVRCPKADKNCYN